MVDLETYLKEIPYFSEADRNAFLALFQVEERAKHSFFAKEGSHPTQIGFMEWGVARAYYENKKKKNYNKTFFTASTFLGAYSALIAQKRNLINIQCLTDCKIWVADYKKIVELFDTHPMIERLARKLAEQFFVQKEKREIDLVMLDAMERYALFQEAYPDLEQLIPQYHIASYLGVSPTQLSRIRAKK